MSKYSPTFFALALPVVVVSLITACAKSRDYAALDASVDGTTDIDGMGAVGRDGAAADGRSTQESNHTGQVSVSLFTDAGGADASTDAATGSDDGSVTSEGDADPSPTPQCENNGDCEDGNECNGVEKCEDGKCKSGEVEDEGTICTGASEEDFVCRNGNCLKSRCGDGLVDARSSEVCDDGNVTNGDGCNVDCTYSCTDDDFCNDGKICNGDETCDLERHVCVAGTKADDATECGTDRACVDGRCLSTACGDGEVTEGEECDDGNLVEGDGCTADCQYDCEQDADCNDENECTGKEVCNLETHQCELGEAPSCDDGIPCTKNECDPIGGCQFPLIDEDKDGQSPIVKGSTCGTDCDDDNAQVFVGAGELCDGIDNNCDGNKDEIATVWYPDCDGDGYAPLDGESVQQCDQPSAPSSCPPGMRGTWTIRAPSDNANADCWDLDPAIYPRTDYVWSTTPIDGRKEYPFDYNCSYSDEPQYTNVNVPINAACSPLVIQPSVELPLDLLSSSDGARALSAEDQQSGVDLSQIQVQCNGPRGWQAATAPACGQPGTYSYCNGCTRAVDVNFLQPCQ